jgi:hypothetical protein
MRTCLTAAVLVLAFVGGKVLAASSKESPVVFSVSLGSFPVKLEETTLNEVVSGVGRGITFAGIDDHERVQNLCYTSGDTYIILSSDFEMGGGQRVMNVQATPVAPEDTSWCWKIPSTFAPVAVNGMNLLGASEVTVRKKFGNAPLGRNGFLKYERSLPASIRAPNDCETYSWLEVVTVSGKVTAFRLGQVTGC